MAESDYYGDSDAAPSAAPQAEEKPKASESKTALIDSSICPGMEPGDEMVVHIEKVLEREYLVSYSPEPSEEKEAEAEPKSEEAPANPAPSMASMYE